MKKTLTTTLLSLLVLVLLVQAVVSNGDGSSPTSPYWNASPAAARSNKRTIRSFWHQARHASRATEASQEAVIDTGLVPRRLTPLLESKKASLVSQRRTFWYDDSSQGQQQQQQEEEATLLVRADDSQYPLEQQVNSRSRPKAWPPWPFNRLTRSSSGDHSSSSSNSHATHNAYGDEPQYRSGASVFWTFSKQSVRVGYKNLLATGNQLWYHLPPAAVPFMMLACIPQKQRVFDAGAVAAADQVVFKRVIPLFANRFARNVALSGLGLAIVSWGHYELHRKKMQTPLPLAPQYQTINRAMLPPFLPEQVPILEHVLQDATEEEEVTASESSDTDSDDLNGNVGMMRQQWKSFLGGAARPNSVGSTLREWRRMREYRRRERANAHRLAVMDELIALQRLKKNAAKRKQQLQQQRNKGNKNGRRNRYSNNNNNNADNKKKEPEDALGYALVTGASRGIGRAIAVELARWDIPLILVARDVDRLTALAYDIESCYGVKCVVLPADLAKPGAAERIYETTQRAGLKIEILINNAGFALHGLAVDQPLEKVNSMIQVNCLSLSSLTHLYGRQMKDRRRGRIMMVSSVCGTVSGLPTVAAYAATKAFDNVLAASMSKEMEPYGVGVFCLMPGAVKGTDFKSNMETGGDALCWKIPFYAKTPPKVARVGVRNMLRGDTQFVVGWQNRMFVKVLKPSLPPRLHNILAEIAFNPLQLPFSRKKPEDDGPREPIKERVPLPPQSTDLPWMKPGYGFNTPPTLLKLDDPSSNEEPLQEEEETPHDSSESAAIDMDPTPLTQEPGSAIVQVPMQSQAESSSAESQDTDTPTSTSKTDDSLATNEPTIDLDAEPPRPAATATTRPSRPTTTRPSRPTTATRPRPTRPPRTTPVPAGP